MAETAVGETAASVLQAIHHIEQRNADVGGDDDPDPVLAKNVRWRLGMSNQLLNYHLNRLEDQNLVEVVGTVDVDAPQPAKEYRLTVEGAKIAAASEARQNVADEHEALQDEVGWLHQRVEQLEERADVHEDAIEELVEHVEQQQQ